VKRLHHALLMVVAAVALWVTHCLSQPAPLAEHEPATAEHDDDDAFTNPDVYP